MIQRRVPWGVLVAVALFAAAPAWAQQAGRKPNVLVIWGDDIGTWNISHNNRGMMGYPTPSIDRIAREGVAFTDYYGQQSYGRPGRVPRRHRPGAHGHDQGGFSSLSTSACAAFSASSGDFCPVRDDWIASSSSLRTRPVWKVNNSGVANSNWSRATTAGGKAAAYSFSFCVA